MKFSLISLLLSSLIFKSKFEELLLPGHLVLATLRIDVWVGPGSQFRVFLLHTMHRRVRSERHVAFQ